MAVNNTLVKTASNSSTQSIVEYKVHGETVTLSPNTVRMYLVSGNGQVTNQEVMMFLKLCQFQHLNPFLREAYLIKYGDSPATMVVGKDVFLRRARAEKDFAGYQAGIIVRDKESGEIIEREGSMSLATEEIVGGWAKIYIKDYVAPIYESVSFSEYAGRTKGGALNSQWSSKPGTMIRKVALAQALREAFPNQNSGMYQAEEIADATADGVVLSETPVIVDEPTKEKEKEKTVPFDEEAEAADALFGAAG